MIALVFIHILALALARADESCLPPPIRIVDQTTGADLLHGINLAEVANMTMSDILSLADSIASSHSLEPRIKRSVMHVLCQTTITWSPCSLAYYGAALRHLSFSTETNTFDSEDSGGGAGSDCPLEDAFVVMSHVASKPGHSCLLYRSLLGLATWKPPPRVLVVAHPAEAKETIQAIVKSDPALSCLSRRLEVVPYPQKDFFLTWEHRKWVEKGYRLLPHARYFAYMEDDILVKSDQYDSWRRDARTMEGTAYIRNFVRYEISEVGDIHAADVEKPVVILPCENCTRDEGERQYVQPWPPYAGLWMLTRRQLEEFMGEERYPYCWNLSKWTFENATGIIRELAAFGPFFCGPEGVSPARSAVPFYTATQRLDPTAVLWHLGNTQVVNRVIHRLGNPTMPIASFLLEDIIQLEREGYSYWDFIR